jgi:isoleucyl-tRNA synthetase
MEKLYGDLTGVTGRSKHGSVHLADFPSANASLVSEELEARMELAQRLTTLVLSIRKREKIRVRQPLKRIMVPVMSAAFEERLRHVEDLVLSEVNVKELEYLRDTGVLVKQVKANFKVLGPRFGKQMKEVAAAIAGMDQDGIAHLERTGHIEVNVAGAPVMVHREEVEISSQDIPGWLVASEAGVTVALDVTLDEALRQEGIARELVNRIQNLRKDTGLEVTDRISVRILDTEGVRTAVLSNREYICREILAEHLDVVGSLAAGHDVEVADGVNTSIEIELVNT